jgi:hypothetical protein
MKCAEFTHEFEEYVSEELPAAQEAEVATHLDACAGCRAQANALRSADEALRALAHAERAPEMLDDLRARLATRPRRTWRWAWAGAAALAAAAVLILCAHRQAVRPLPLPAPVKLQARAPQGDTERQTATVVAPAPRAGEDALAAPEHVHRRLVKRPASGGARNNAAPALKHRSNRQTTPDAASAPERRSDEPAPERKQEPAPQPAEPAAPQDAPVEVAQAPGGVILLLGAPEPILPSGSCYLEVSFPDGSTSVTGQAVERDAAGEPKAVQVTYLQTAAEGPHKEG